MQLIELSLSHFNFYCPATGELLCNEDDGVNEDAKSLMAYWLDLVFEEPHIKDETLKKDWKAFQDKYADENFGSSPNFEAFESWLKEYNRGNWVVFVITNSGISCGPSSSTVWWVIDMDTFTEEEDYEDIDLFDNVEDNPV